MASKSEAMRQFAAENGIPYIDHPLTEMEFVKMPEPRSIFAPSRRAAQQIMEDKAKPVFFETTDEARVRDHLVNNCGLTNDQVTQAMDGYKIINTAKRMLRIQP